MDKSPEELDKLFFDENGKPNENIFGNAFEEIKAHASKFKAAFEPMDLSDLTELSDDDIYDNLPMILFDDDANDTKKIARIAYEFDAEFGNGGVSQYFANTRGEFVLELASALEAIGAVKYAKSCDEFIKKYSIRPENFDDTIKDYFKVAESLYPYKELETEKKLVIAGGTSDSEEHLKELTALADGDSKIIFTGFYSSLCFFNVKNRFIHIFPLIMFKAP